MLVWGESDVGGLLIIQKVTEGQELGVVPDTLFTELVSYDDPDVAGVTLLGGRNDVVKQGKYLVWQVRVDSDSLNRFCRAFLENK